MDELKIVYGPPPVDQEMLNADEEQDGESCFAES
jgi:hypothetical protein